jgi:hypothetical protein
MCDRAIRCVRSVSGRKSRGANCFALHIRCFRTGLGRERLAIYAFEARRLLRPFADAAARIISLRQRLHSFTSNGGWAERTSQARRYDVCLELSFISLAAFA